MGKELAGLSNEELLLLYRQEEDEERKNEIAWYIADLNKNLTRGVISSQNQALLQDYMEDLMQESILRLRQLVDRYDPTRGTKFSTFVVPHLKELVKNANAEATGKSVYHARMEKKYRSAEEKIIADGGDPKDQGQICQELGIGPTALRNMILAGEQNRFVYLDDSENTVAIEIPDYETPEAAFFKRDPAKDLQDEIEKMTDEEKAVMRVILEYFNEQLERETSNHKPKILASARYIAEKTGFSERMVQTIRNSIRKKLAANEHLAKYNSSPVSSIKKTVESYRPKLKRGKRTSVDIAIHIKL